MNLILFCGRTSAPMLAAVCRPMAKPLLQDARFRGRNPGGELGGCMVYLLGVHQVRLVDVWCIYFSYLLSICPCPLSTINNGFTQKNRTPSWCYGIQWCIIKHLSTSNNEFTPPPKKKKKLPAARVGVRLFLRTMDSPSRWIETGNCPPSYAKNCRKIGMGASGWVVAPERMAHDTQ